MSELAISSFGDLQYSYESVMKNRILQYMDYRDYSENIHITGEQIDENLYVVNMQQQNNSEMFKTKVINKNIGNFINHDNLPTMYNWNNASEKDRKGDKFIIHLPLGNIDSSLFIEKDNIVIFDPKGKVLLIYPTADGKAIYSNYLESYVFTEKGYFCKNKKDMNFSACFGKIFANYKLLRKNPNMGNIILDQNPTLIEYITDIYPEKTFYFNYDEYGMVCGCCDEDPNKILSRYELQSYAKNNIEIINIHPLLFDPFNPNYNDIPFKYWVENKLNIDNNICTLFRNVYMMDNDQSKKILELIPQNPHRPILQFLDK